MKAAVLQQIGKPLAVVDVPRPKPGVGEVLVQVRTCGICRTDLHIQDGLAYVPSLPHIPGHEPAGVVVELGAGVTEIDLGQRVVPHLFVRREECRYTLAGQHAQASHLKGIIGVTLPGGFAEYFVAPVENLLLLPQSVPFDAGGLTSCAVVTAVHAFHKSGLEANDSAVVLGAGGIGLMLVQLLARAGVRTAAISRSAESLKLAQQAGASLTLLSGADDAPDRIRAMAGDDKEGADCVFELVGRAETMRIAANCTMRGGKIIVIGEEADFAPINTIEIAQRELQIVGSRNGGMQDARDAIDFLARGVIRPLVAATYPLEQINEALDAVRSGKVHGRVVIQVSL